MKLNNEFPWRYFRRILSYQLILISIVILLTVFGARAIFRTHFIEQSSLQLKDFLISLSHVEHNTLLSSEFCNRYAQGTIYRLTLVQPDGVVHCDSHAEVSKMENHGTRPEIIEAKLNGWGHSLRKSDTIQQEMLYVAIPVSSDKGWTLRGAIPFNRLERAQRYFTLSFLALWSFIALGLTLFSIWSSRKLVMPMKNLLTRIRSTSLAKKDGHLSGEWSELEGSFDQLNIQLEKQVLSLLREQEQQATILAAISHPILAIDPNFELLFFNQKFSQYFGISQSSTIKRPDSVLNLLKQYNLQQYFGKAINNNEAFIIDPSAIFLPIGKRILSLIVSPLCDPSGKVYGAVGVFQDWTEIKTAELRQRDFVANVSHELRSPMTAILGFLDTIQGDLREGRNINPVFFEVVREESRRLMDLIQDILYLAEFDELIKVKKTWVDTLATTQRVIQRLQPNFVRKKQLIEMEISLPKIFTSQIAIEQVLQNLIDNASKYCQEGALIKVIWDQDSLRILDNGPGIDQIHLAKIFDRFYRADQSRSRALGGTGLGLAIVKELMEQQGGVVRVESKLEEGTVFICEFSINH